MMKKADNLLTIVPALLLLVSLCFATQISDNASPSLKGLEAVFVLVEDLPRGAVEIGLTTEKLKAVTESKLRQAGLSVPTFSYDDPYLYISIHVVDEAFSVEVSLRESVVVKRRRSMTGRAVTWLNSITGVHRGDGNLFLDGLQEILDAFISDFHKANPKKGPR